MKKETIKKILDMIKKSYIVGNYLTYKVDNEKLKVFYNDKVVTICETMGYAYLLMWWCDGSITSSEAKHFNDILRGVNDEY